MQHQRAILNGKALGRPMLGLLLAALLVFVSLGSAVHAERHFNDPAHHTCAACLIAHGGVLADGAIGAVAVLLSGGLILLQLREFIPVLQTDLRLAPGRAPPV